MGIGAGSVEHMTQRARDAIAEADTLRAEHEAEASIDALAAHYGLPAGYIRATLDEPWKPRRATLSIPSVTV
jgi:precorrin-2 methylase